MKDGTIRFELSKKQLKAYKFLIDSITNELVFGGGARGGKSFLGAFWIIVSATQSYPGSSWLVAREELKALKRTTLRTFFAVLKMLGLEKDKHYNYNAQDMVLKFINGSVVFFAELKRIPSDPEFDRIGSYDLTGAWIDEAQEICKDAKDALQFRFTSLSGNGWSTIPKTLYTCNPKRNWIFTDFWRPLIKEKKQIKGSQFITSLYTDNPYIDHKKYRENVLRTKNKIKIERLLKGNFEYDDDPSRLYDLDLVEDIFTNQGKRGIKYIVSDASRKGRDKFIIQLWDGLQCIKTIDLSYNIKSDSVKAANFIIELAEKEGVRRSHILLDSDGLGGPIVDIIKCKGFVNNGAPIKTEAVKKQEKKGSYLINYANLKTQCAFKLLELMEAGEVGIENIPENLKELLKEEFFAIKQKDIDNDKKVALEPKDCIKEAIGRSPDIWDTVNMRMYFELIPVKEFVNFIG